MNLIINLERPPENILKKEEHVAIKCYNAPGDNDDEAYQINVPFCEGGSPE